MLLPLNVAVALPAELQDPAPHVANSIEDFLKSSGRTVDPIGLCEARDAWAFAAKSVRSSPELEQEFGIVAR